jgi:DNA-binding NarL/FixJ family response regulator
MLEQPGVNRIRVSWHVGDSELKAVILDDGPGALDPEALAMYRIADRLSALNGTLAMDPVPEWGTTVTASLPLEPPDAPKSDPLRVLNPREVDVLDQLTLGRRNRQIAETLHISEHTVKFHVTNILVKLAVGSRGEAAALAKTVGRTS